MNSRYRPWSIAITLMILVSPMATTGFGQVQGGQSKQQSEAKAKQEAKGKLKQDGAKPITLAISGEIDAELAPVVGQLTTLFYESYPKLLKRFDNPAKPAPRNIRLVLAPRLRVPAYYSNATITVSAEWLRRHPDDLGLLTHELTHAVQAYPVYDPGWLTEGLADYARDLYGPEKQPGWALPSRLTTKQNYTDSYRVTGRFLLWLDTRHPGVVDKLHRKMQNREFVLEDFQTLTGTKLDDLWQECVSDLGKKP